MGNIFNVEMMEDGWIAVLLQSLVCSVIIGDIKNYYHASKGISDS